MVRNIPHLALIPLVILWFGIDESAKLFLVALGVFFPIYLNTLHGIRTVDPQLIEMGRIYGMTDGELFRRVIFPGALPSIFVGLRFALGIMWLTLIVAETIAASSGLGYMAMQAREFMLIDVVVLAHPDLRAARQARRQRLARAGAADAVLASGLPETLRDAIHARSPSFRRRRRRAVDQPGFRRTGAAGARRLGSAASRGLSLTIRGLRKSFGDNEVLRGIDLHIPAGPVRRDRRPQRLRQEHAAAADRGPRDRSTPAASASASRRAAGRCPRHVPGAAAVALGARAVECRGRPRPRPRARRTRRPRAESALAEVGLDDKRDQWPAVLSGGQKQRVALARALVSQPRVLAFDEPLGALDALTRISMQRLLERVWRDQGFTAILVTHDVAEAVALADRVLVIEEGRIAHDIHVDIPRPRRRGSADLAALEGSILRDLLQGTEETSDL